MTQLSLLFKHINPAKIQLYFESPNKKGEKRQLFATPAESAK